MSKPHRQKELEGTERKRGCVGQKIVKKPLIDRRSWRRQRESGRVGQNLHSPAHVTDPSTTKLRSHTSLSSYHLIATTSDVGFEAPARERDYRENGKVHAVIPHASSDGRLALPFHVPAYLSHPHDISHPIPPTLSFGGRAGGGGGGGARRSPHQIIHKVIIHMLKEYLSRPPFKGDPSREGFAFNNFLYKTTTLAGHSTCVSAGRLHAVRCVLLVGVVSVGVP